MWVRERDSQFSFELSCGWTCNLSLFQKENSEKKEKFSWKVVVFWWCERRNSEFPSMRRINSHEEEWKNLHEDSRDVVNSITVGELAVFNRITRREKCKRVVKSGKIIFNLSSTAASDCIRFPLLFRTEHEISFDIFRYINAFSKKKSLWLVVDYLHTSDSGARAARAETRKEEKKENIILECSALFSPFIKSIFAQLRRRFVLFTARHCARRSHTRHGNKNAVRCLRWLQITETVN